MWFAACPIKCTGNHNNTHIYSMGTCVSRSHDSMIAPAEVVIAKPPKTHPRTSRVEGIMHHDDEADNLNALDPLADKLSSLGDDSLYVRLPYDFVITYVPFTLHHQSLRILFDLQLTRG